MAFGDPYYGQYVVGDGGHYHGQGGYYGGAGYQAVPTFTTNNIITTTGTNPYQLQELTGQFIQQTEKLNVDYNRAWPDDPIAWLKRRVQETIDEVDWAA